MLSWAGQFISVGQPDGDQLAPRGIQPNQQYFFPGRSAGTPNAASVIECDKRVLFARDLLNDTLANELPVAMHMMARATICCLQYCPSSLDC